MNNCEDCKYYCYKANIIGGIAKCNLDIKGLNTFWTNEACEKYQETDKQNDYCKFHLGDALEVRPLKK